MNIVDAALFLITTLEWQRELNQERSKKVQSVQTLLTLQLTLLSQTADIIDHGIQTIATAWSQMLG